MKIILLAVLFLANSNPWCIRDAKNNSCIAVCKQACVFGFIYGQDRVIDCYEAFSHADICFCFGEKKSAFSDYCVEEQP